MPANKPYPGENPAAAQKRIAKNRVKNPGAVKPKSDMMASNISSTIKNMGGGY